MHELCRSVEEQFVADKFSQEQILAIEHCGLTENAEQQLSELRSELHAMQVAGEVLHDEAEKWRSDAGRLRGIEERFNEYFHETQAWIALQEEAKIWHQEQAAYWKSQAERLTRAPDRTF
jgi:hypothetical protein